MVKFNAPELLKLASDFEEKSVDTLRSGELPSSEQVKSPKPEVSVEEAEPLSFDSYLDLAVINLIEAKKDLDSALKHMKEFNPEIEMDLYNAQYKMDRAKHYYTEAVNV